MRRVIVFPCVGETLFGTLDEAAGATGLLIVSGGNEVRAGAHRGMAELAATLAGQGIPVFRFDRRGVGDATGENTGWEGSAADLAAAAAAFRAAAPHVSRLAGFGNCDGATTLALYGAAAGIDRLILANPYVVEPIDDLPPAPALRARYARRLRDPAAWRRVLTGGVRLAPLLRGLRRALAGGGETALSNRILTALAGRDATVILASGDATARTFAAIAGRTSIPTITIGTPSHSFARQDDAASLAVAITETIASV